MADVALVDMPSESLAPDLLTDNMMFRNSFLSGKARSRCVVAHPNFDGWEFVPLVPCRLLGGALVWKWVLSCVGF